MEDLVDPSRLDFDLCICLSEITGLWALGLSDRFPVEVAPFSRLTSGFSMGQGQKILETQGLHDTLGDI